MGWELSERMRWIGLTGGIATGKSTVARLLRALGAPVVCADELSRAAVRRGAEGFEETVAAFGPGVVGPDGELDRRALGARVFSDPSARARLEAIIHPRVRAEQRRLRAEAEKSGAPIGFYDVPLLFEKNLEGDFDATVAVLCSEAAQLERLVARDGWSIEEAKKRIASQLPLAEKRRRADHVIENDGSLADLERATRLLLAELGRPAAK